MSDFTITYNLVDDDQSFALPFEVYFHADHEEDFPKISGGFLGSQYMTCAQTIGILGSKVAHVEAQAAREVGDYFSASSARYRSAAEREDA